MYKEEEGHRARREMTGATWLWLILILWITNRQNRVRLPKIYLMSSKKINNVNQIMSNKKAWSMLCFYCYNMYVKSTKPLFDAIWLTLYFNLFIFGGRVLDTTCSSFPLYQRDHTERSISIFPLWRRSTCSITISRSSIGKRRRWSRPAGPAQPGRSCLDKPTEWVSLATRVWPGLAPKGYVYCTVIDWLKFRFYINKYTHIMLLRMYWVLTMLTSYLMKE